jgi:hypothetical protein
MKNFWYASFVACTPSGTVLNIFLKISSELKKEYFGDL